MTNQRPRVHFLALETYKFPGGIQRFNRRVIDALAAMTRDGVAAASVLIKGDRPADVPADVTIVTGYGNDRPRMMRAALSGARPDVVLIGHINLLPLAALVKARWPSTRLVLFVHGDDVWNKPEFRSRRAWEPALLRIVDTIASVSRFTAGVMAREYRVPSERFAYFPNATDIDAAAPPPAPPAGGTVLCVTRVGSGDRRKNIDRLIEAFAIAAPRIPATMLELVGDGPLLPDLRRAAAAHGVADRIRFLGSVSDDELALCYDRAGLFALPSDKEGFGIVYLEAWRHGVPVLCSDQGAPHEIIDDGVDGWVIDPRDTARFADVLVEAFADPAHAAAMGRMGYGKVVARYSGPAFARRLRALVAGDSHDLG